MSKQYKLRRGSLQWQFQQSRAKIQIFAGGFANGKTTSSVIKALMLGRDYPGMNALIARSTYPKLNDTIRKEFLAWCPENWIKRVSLSENVVVLKNGSTFNFRYIAQQGKSAESTTSNLLSATYDLIVVDQVEDPEITHKDFLDLLGRMRGSTRYKGEDDTMPRTGPRWMILTCNPTRNWVYRKLVKPLQDFKQRGVRTPDLLVDAEGNPLIELFEGSTYSNRENLAEDYIAMQEAAYTGQMRARFLLGEWGGYEGLVYPQYDPQHHLVPQDQIRAYIEQLVLQGYGPQDTQSYDHGIAVPLCYLIAVTDAAGNVIVVDGHYEKEMTIEQAARVIKRLQSNLALQMPMVKMRNEVLADPAVFKRSSTTNVGDTVANLFRENGVRMVRATNSIQAGIAKVQQYLSIDPGHINPFTGQHGAPRLYVSDHLHWFDNEISDYYWKRNNSGEHEDVPKDVNDHAMDALKYLLTDRPKLATLVNPVRPLPPDVFTWNEIAPREVDRRRTRYGYQPH